MVMAKWSLPEGWEWLPVSTIACDTDRRNPKFTSEEYFDYIDIGSIDNQTGQIIAESVKRIKGADAPSRARKVIHTGDIIFATTRPYLRNIALVPKNYHNQICSTGFCVLRANEERVVPQYLYNATRSTFFIDQLIPKQRGASYPAVVDTDVFATEFPIPYPDDPEHSLAEQRRIIARIQALSAELMEMQELKRQIINDTENLLEATVTNVYNQLGKVYQVVSLGDNNVCQIIPGQHIMARDYSESPVGIPYITGPSDFGDKYAQISKWTTNPKAFCQPGDILFTVKGSGVGKTNFAPQNSNCCISRQIMALRPNPQNLLSDYLFYNLSGRFREFQSLRQGAAIPGIRKEHVEAIEIPLPPCEVQKNIIANLEKIYSEISEMRTINEKDRELLDQMGKAILTKAFQGEL
jgi:type I restriction enzyme S subunit